MTPASLPISLRDQRKVLLCGRASVYISAIGHFGLVPATFRVLQFLLRLPRSNFQHLVHQIMRSDNNLESVIQVPPFNCEYQAREQSMLPVLVCTSAFGKLVESEAMQVNPVPPVYRKELC